MKDHLAEIIIASVIFVIVSALGFVAARWRRPSDMAHLDEWGLGGRSFGSLAHERNAGMCEGRPCWHGQGNCRCVVSS